MSEGDDGARERACQPEYAGSSAAAETPDARRGAAATRNGRPRESSAPSYPHRREGDTSSDARVQSVPRTGILQPGSTTAGLRSEDAAELLSRLPARWANESEAAQARPTPPPPSPSAAANREGRTDRAGANRARQRGAGEAAKRRRRRIDDSLRRFNRERRCLAFMLVAALVLGRRWVRLSVASDCAVVEDAACCAANLRRSDRRTVRAHPRARSTSHAHGGATAERLGRKAEASGGQGRRGAAAVKADPSSQGILDTMQLPAGRRIVVDGRVVGTSPRRVAIRCGVHRIQIGAC